MLARARERTDSLGGLSYMDPTDGRHPLLCSNNLYIGFHWVTWIQPVPPTVAVSTICTFLRDAPMFASYD